MEYERPQMRRYTVKRQRIFGEPPSSESRADKDFEQWNAFEL